MIIIIASYITTEMCGTTVTTEMCGSMVHDRQSIYIDLCE